MDTWLDAQMALQKVTDLLDQAREVTRSVTTPLTAEAVARMPELQLRADPVLAAEFRRGWEARTADLQRALQVPAPTNCPQLRTPGLRAVQKRRPSQQPVTSGPHANTTAAPAAQTKWLSESQKRLRLRPHTDPHPTSTEWTGVPKTTPRILTIWWPLVETMPVAVTATVVTPGAGTSGPAAVTDRTPPSEDAKARKNRKFAKLAAKKKAWKKGSRQYRLEKRQPNLPTTLPVPVTGKSSTELVEVDLPASETKPGLGIPAG